MRMPTVAAGLCLALIVAEIVLGVIGGTFAFSGDWGTERVALAAAVPALAFPTVGWLVATRRPGNAVGRLCLAIGCGISITLTAGVYGHVALETRHHLPGGEFARWLADWSYTPWVVGLGVFLPLLFPDGRLISPRWRIVVGLGAAVIVLGSLSEALRPGRLANTDALNPYGIESARGLLLGLDNVFVLLPVSFVAAAASVVVRYRRSGARERLQLKWFVSAGLVLALLFVLQYAFAQGAAIQDVVMAMFAALPVAVGIAILRHQLYDIETIINRALVYTALTVTLAAAYGATVLLAQVLLPDRSDLGVAISTLAAAAVFGPARRRIQHLVDRRFYRRRYDAALTVSAFGGRARDQVALDALSADLVGVIDELMQPDHVSLWLRGPASS
jgi:hypothetical protein